MGTALSIAIYVILKVAILTAVPKLVEHTVDGPVQKQVEDESDGGLSRRLLGSWTETGTTEDGGATISGTETYYPNGTSTFVGTVTILKDGKTISYSGGSTWRVEGGKLHEKITQANYPELVGKPPDLVGTALDYDIVNLTDEELTVRDNKDGKIGTLRRISK